jgi:hypothetical protein
MRERLFEENAGTRTPSRIKHRAESNTDQNQHAENQYRLNHKGTKDTKQEQAKFVAILAADLDRRLDRRRF